MNEAACTVTGATKLASLQSLYKETGWESLAFRREKIKTCTLLQNTKWNDSRISFISCTPSVAGTTRYRLRNESDLQTIHAY